MKRSLVFLAWSFAFAADAPGGSVANSCEAEYIRLDKALADLTYEQLDPLNGRGLPTLRHQRCFEQGARIIKKFLLPRPGLTELQRSSLLYQQGHALAMTGDTASAIRLFGQSFRAEEETHGFRWNAYVRGAIAFLQRDTAALLAAKTDLDQNQAKNVGNRLNLETLESFLNHPNATYAQAYDEREREK